MAQATPVVTAWRPCPSPASPQRSLSPIPGLRTTGRAADGSPVPVGASWESIGPMPALKSVRQTFPPPAALASVAALELRAAVPGPLPVAVQSQLAPPPPWVVHGHVPWPSRSTFPVPPSPATAAAAAPGLPLARASSPSPGGATACVAVRPASPLPQIPATLRAFGALPQPLPLPAEQGRCPPLVVQGAPNGDWVMLRKEVEAVLKESADLDLQLGVCHLCGSSLDGNLLTENREPANRRLARGLEVVWSRAAAFAHEGAQWAEEVRQHDAEIARLGELLTHFRDEYPKQVEVRVRDMQAESLAQVQSLEVEVGVRRSVLPLQRATSQPPKQRHASVHVPTEVVTPPRAPDATEDASDPAAKSCGLAGSTAALPVRKPVQQLPLANIGRPVTPRPRLGSHGDSPTTPAEGWLVGPHALPGHSCFVPFEGTSAPHAPPPPEATAAFASPTLGAAWPSDANTATDSLPEAVQAATSATTWEIVAEPIPPQRPPPQVHIRSHDESATSMASMEASIADSVDASDATVTAAVAAVRAARADAAEHAKLSELLTAVAARGGALGGGTGDSCGGVGVVTRTMDGADAGAGNADASKTDASKTKDLDGLFDRVRSVLARVSAGHKSRSITGATDVSTTAATFVPEAPSENVERAMAPAMQLNEPHLQPHQRWVSMAKEAASTREHHHAAAVTPEVEEGSDFHRRAPDVTPDVQQGGDSHHQATAATIELQESRVRKATRSASGTSSHQRLAGRVKASDVNLGDEKSGHDAASAVVRRTRPALASRTPSPDARRVAGARSAEGVDAMSEAERRPRLGQACRSPEPDMRKAVGNHGVVGNPSAPSRSTSPLRGKGDGVCDGRSLPAAGVDAVAPASGVVGGAESAPRKPSSRTLHQRLGNVSFGGSSGTELRRQPSPPRRAPGAPRGIGESRQQASPPRRAPPPIVNAAATSASAAKRRNASPQRANAPAGLERRSR